MDRPKHRRLILLGFVLLTGAGLLLFGRQWTSAPVAVPAPDRISSRQLVEPEPEKVQPPPVAAAALSAPAPPSAPPSAVATGFRGRIIDAVTRQSVKEFEVQLTPVTPGGGYIYTEGAQISRHFKSATGRFSWADVAEGTWRAAVTASGYQQFNVDDLHISPGKATREIVMPLLRGYAVRGRVFERSTGAGVVDASITFRPAGAEEDYRRRRAGTTSKQDGSFTLDGVTGGDVVLTVVAQGHAPQAIAIVVDERTPAQEIAVSSGGTIAGTAMSPAGAPVKGSLQLLGPDMNFVTETNEAGRFSFRHLQTGRYRVSAGSGAGKAAQVIALGEDESQENIVLVVEAGRSIRGMIRGANQPDSVHLVVRPDSKPGSISGRVDKQGAYALNGVPPGHAVIRVFSHGLQFDKPVDVPTDQDVTLDIVFPAGGRLSGRVTQGGKPLVHKQVWMRPVENTTDTLYRATTSEEGQYAIEGLPPGDYFLRADEDVSRRIAIAGDAMLNIDIPSVQLSARVVEDGGAVPIVGANVYLRGSAPETARVRGDKQTDDFGQFAFTGIESGEIVLMVYKAGYEMHREKITYSSPITNQTITLRKDAGVEVRVRPGSRRFPIGFTITQSFPGNDYIVDLWMPLDHEGTCHVPSALAGTTLQIGRFSGKPIVMEDWDGQPFELP